MEKWEPHSKKKDETLTWSAFESLGSGAICINHYDQHHVTNRYCDENGCLIKRRSKQGCLFAVGSTIHSLFAFFFFFLPTWAQGIIHLLFVILKLPTEFDWPCRWIVTDISGQKGSEEDEIEVTRIGYREEGTQSSKDRGCCWHRHTKRCLTDIPGEIPEGGIKKKRELRGIIIATRVSIKGFRETIKEHRW